MVRFPKWPPPVALSGSPINVYGFAEYDGLLYLGGRVSAGSPIVLHSFDGANFTEIVGSPIFPSDFKVYAGSLYFSGIDASGVPTTPRMWVLSPAAVPVLAATGTDTSVALGLGVLALTAGLLVLLGSNTARRRVTSRATLR